MTTHPPDRPLPAVEAHRAGRSLGADIIIANAPDPVFVSDLEGKILQANDAVSELLGFRPAELIEQSLSRFISPEETREFTAALKEVVAKGVTRNARLNPRSASGETIPTTMNASALRDPDGRRWARMMATLTGSDRCEDGTVVAALELATFLKPDVVRLLGGAPVPAPAAG